MVQTREGFSATPGKGAGMREGPVWTTDMERVGGRGDSNRGARWTLPDRQREQGTVG